MDEEENELKEMEESSESLGVKSTAVVKYTAFQSPVSYSRLQCNTDLNLPPSNWSATIDAYGLKQILTGHTGLSSFRMAHMFPDSVGEVDVISGAECIKKLLKLPFQTTGTVSMIVHRVENTLLLDDFNVLDYLMKSEWSWLKDFFYENILKTMSEQERMALMLAPPASSSRQLTHKFLSHSVPHPPQPTRDAPAAPVCLTGPFLPEPEIRSQEPSTDHLYSRNVLWTFEDIHMLIGSDLPIFGDKDRPCVSLRLRDAREPINVLTGIDYWLDNLMCNVPEVVMCCHIDGIVQKYEPMKTEDLPNLENSKFSPEVIKNVAQNILSFLKRNVTRAGHTYWLFKGPCDDAVKLYDLTTLCLPAVDNPFTTPVGMLLYRVARNMRLTNRTRHVRQLLEHAIKLLKVERYPQIVASSHYMLADLYVPATTDPACPVFKEESSDSDNEDDVEYGGETGYGECGTDGVGGTARGSAEAKGASGGTARGDDEVGEVVSCLALQIRGLALQDIGGPAREHRASRKQKGNESKCLGIEPAQRCGCALRHALHGLRALHHITIHKDKEEERERLRQQIIIEEQHPKMANPYEPIKMKYEPLSKKKGKELPKEQSKGRRRKREKKSSETSKDAIVDKNAILVRKEKNVFPTWHEPNRDDNFAWKLHLKTLLYEKMCIVYATLAEYSYANEQYGFSLKYIDLATKCQKLLSNMIIKSRVIDASCLIGRVGDNYFQLSKNWAAMEKYRKQFETDHEVDSSLRIEIEKDMAEEIGGAAGDEFDLDISLPSSDIEAIMLSCSLYRRAMSTSNRRDELLRRLASVTNELGVRYMNEAEQIYVKYMDELDSNTAMSLLKQFSSVIKRSWEYLKEATVMFEEVKDLPNLVLLYCNKGRYLRFKAHCDYKTGFTMEKRSLYSRAEELYKSALKLLGSRESCPATSVWDLVSWELSCHVYTRAVVMQECPIDPCEPSEVADAFKYALKYCNLSPGPRQYMYQFRVAMIHYKLGSLYHAQYRLTTVDGPRRRSLFNSTRSHYEQAANMFATLEDVGMYLTAQMEHVAVLEAQAAITPNLKLKSFQSAIQILRQCHSIMTLIKDRDPSEQTTPTKPEDQDEKGMICEYNLLGLYESRLHFILKSIIQYCRSKSNKDYEKMTDMYKKLYCASLRIKKDNDSTKYAASICDVLENMNQISKEFES